MVMNNALQVHLFTWKELYIDGKIIIRKCHGGQKVKTLENWWFSSNTALIVKLPVHLQKPHLLPSVESPSLEM